MGTAKKTEEYFNKIQFPNEILRLKRSGFSTSALGFGSYRIAFGNKEHEEALRTALLSGCNLIDTSANYGDGLSERLIGKVLLDLNQEGLLDRDEVILVTKAGYIQGENLTLAAAKEKQGTPFLETVKVSEGCYHSISIDFLEDQIERSIKRMSIHQIDFFLLHNPEYFLKATKNNERFYEKIKIAFEFLEAQVNLGKIKYYGISSNTFGEDESEESFCSLKKCVEIAESLSMDHHFAMIQFPLNLYESGAVFNKNNNSQTLLEYAKTKNLITLINRPFNSYHGKQMRRLTDFPFHEELNDEKLLDQKFAHTQEIERSCPKEYQKSFEYIRFAEVLNQAFLDIQDIATWKEIRDFQIMPYLHQYEDQIAHFANPDMRVWFSKYINALEDLLKHLTFYFENKAHKESIALQELLLDQAPELKSSPMLTQKLLQLYRSIDGVDIVLVGMRKPHYVSECLKLQKKLTNEKVKEVLSYFIQ